MAEYIEIPFSGRLRGVTYEDGKVADVHIMDTDEVVKVFVPVRHGRWNDSLARITPYCSACGHSHRCLIRTPNYCPHCGAKMDGGAD